MKSNHSRFEIHSRRSLLVRSVAVGALVTLPGLACGSSDKDAFADVTTTPIAATDAPATDAPATDAPTTAGDTTAPVSTEAPSTDAPSTGSDDAFPAGGELLVNFSFTPESSGPSHNPYIAVWVEDLDGNLVKTVSLWVEQSFKAEKYIHEMRAYYATSGGDLTMSSATRVAGEYSVSWDGTDNEGNTVAAGDYVLFIEGAREHGPYELISQQVTVGPEAFDIGLEDSGEITGVSLQLVV